MPSPSNNPIPVALESLLTDIFRQYEVTEEQAKAWLAVSSQLKAGNPELFTPRVTGMECALLEVKRLQQCERELAELSLAKGKADAAPTQQPAAVPTKQVHGDTKAAYFTGAASQANAGPEPGDMPIDRFIASVPLPTYALKKPPAGELPVLPEPVESTCPTCSAPVSVSATKGGTAITISPDTAAIYAAQGYEISYTTPPASPVALSDADKRDAALKIARSALVSVVYSNASNKLIQKSDAAINTIDAAIAASAKEAK